MEDPTIIPGLAGAPPAQGLLTQLLDSLAPDEVRRLSMLAEEHSETPDDEAAESPEHQAAEDAAGVESGGSDGGGDGDANAGGPELSAEDQAKADDAATAAAQEAANTQATEAQSMVEEMHGFKDKADSLRDDAESANDEEPEDGQVERTTIDLDAFDEKLAMFDAMIEEAEESADACQTAADKEKYEECGTAYAEVSAKFAAAEELLRELTSAVQGDGLEQAAEAAPDAPESPLTAWMQTYKG